MTEQQRQEYLEKHDRRMKRFDREFIRRAYTALQAQIDEAIAILKTAGVDGLRLRLDKLVFVQDLAPVIRDIYASASLYFARRTYAEIQASVREVKAGGFGFDEQWTAQIIEYLRKYLLTKAVLPISQTTKEHILLILEKGKNEGWSVDRMAFELENSELTLARARLIVRTELAMAENLGRDLGRDASPFESTKVWIAAKDRRTRHSHRDMNGQTLDSKQRFSVPRYRKNLVIGYDRMTGPGDPTASPENICNCRCVMALRVKRDAKGDFIRKRKIFVALPGEFSRPREAITI